MRRIIGFLYIVREYERAVRETFGRFSRYLHPGLHFQFPFIQLTRTRDIREHTMDIIPQQVITKDNVEINVDGIMWVKPGDNEEFIKRTFYNIDRWKSAVIELAQTNLRQEFGHLTLDESLVAREKISSNLQTSLDELTENWGLKVTKVEIKLIDPPEDIKIAMHKQKTAEQERRAMKLLATGRFEAAEQDKLAAIQIADGTKEAEIKIAEGKAKAIELVNKAAQEYFIDNAQELKRIEMTESSLKNNSKIILTQEGINPNLLIGHIPVEQQNKPKEKSDTKPKKAAAPESLA